MQLGCHVRFDGAARGGRVETHLAAEKIVRRKTAEHQIAVGDRRLAAATAITGGPRYGARTLRAHFELTEAIHTRERAAAGADRVDVDHRKRNIAPLDLAAILDRRLAVFDQRDIAGRAAHVEGDEITQARR